MLNIGCPQNIDSLYEFNDDVSNPALFEDWKPKINAYLEALDKEALLELRVPATEVPNDLDSRIFNTVSYITKSSHLSDKEKEITSLSVTDLSARIASKELTSVETLKAFAHRAVILNQFTNFAMEFFINEALTTAAALDKHLAETGSTVGPFHGIPISLKEQIGYGGKITHAGYVGMLTNITKEDATTIKVLKKLGAVLFVRTNQPQTLMHMDTNNNITGRTRNPYNSLLSPGGSSGGEGCCVAGRGSAIGVGTDIGGSIRAPAAFSGCFGLRPTTRRISIAGGISAGKGQESVVAVAGPIANSVEDIDLFMDGYINKGMPWDDDPWSLPIPWRKLDKPSPKDITVAFMGDDGLVTPHPPITRGLNYLKSKLEAAGVNAIKFNPIDIKEAYDVVSDIYACDGNYAQKCILKTSGEPLLPLTKWAMSIGKGNKQLTITENRELNYNRDVLRKKYNDYFVKNKVDFIVAPTYVGVASVGIDDGIAGPYYWGYTALFNLLDLPTLACQTGLLQDPKVDVKGESYIARSDLDKIEQDKYIAELFEGAPIGFQLAGRRYFDEEVVAFGKVISEILKL